jgi:nitrite reductase (NO-forming)
MSDPQLPIGPRALPGQEGSPVSRAGMAVVGVVIVVALAVTGLLVRPALAAAGAPAPAASGAAVGGAATGHTTEVTVMVDGMAFAPSSIDVPAGDRLRVTLENTGDQRHDLVFANGATTGVLAPGTRGTVDAGVITADLEGWCSLPGHRQMGMVIHVHAVGAVAAATPAPSSSGGAMAAMDGGSSSAPTMADLQKEAAALPAYPAELPPLEATTDHSYTFHITERPDPVTGALTRQVWTYNGTSPGPILHGRIGDTFHITLVNDATMGHSIDFHAGELAPDQPMRTIEPGQSLEYTFTASRAGIWMYHCSTMPMSNHIANGMFGAVVIEPAGLEPVAHSYVVVQSEQYLGANGQPADAAKIAAMTPDVVTFNGRAFQYDAHHLTARVGERVRFWVLDAGPNLALSFHVVGAQFDTVWSEGSYSVRDGVAASGAASGAAGAQVLPLLAAQGGFVDLVPKEAGHYAFVDHAMSLAEKGAHGVLEVTP